MLNIRDMYYRLSQSPSQVARQIQVISTVETHQVDDIFPSPENAENAITTSRPVSSKFILEILKVTTVPVLAAFSSFAVPVFIILIETNHGTQTHLTLEQKLLHTLLPYTIMTVFRTWVIWNSIGQRMDGRVDDDIPILDEACKDDTGHVVVTLLANMENFFEAQLAVSAVFSDYPRQVIFPSSVVLGILSYMTNLFTEEVSAFRKHAESSRKQGKHIKPFFKQPVIAWLICGRPQYYAVFLREVLPTAAGIIRAMVTTQAATALLPKTMSASTVPAIRLSLGLITYWASAYFIHFELEQITDTLQAQGISFEITNTFSRSSRPAVQLVGKMRSGEIFIDILRKLKLSMRSSVNFSLVFAALGFIVLIQKALHLVSSDNVEAVHAGQEGIVMSYYVGQEEAIRLAPKIEVAITCTAAVLGIVGVFSRSAILHKHAARNVHQIVNSSEEQRSDERVVLA